MTYITKQGDMWDGIAYTQMGSTDHADLLMRANPQFCGVFVFPAGVSLEIPEVDTSAGSNLPPWKAAVG